MNQNDYKQASEPNKYVIIWQLCEHSPSKRWDDRVFADMKLCLIEVAKLNMLSNETSLFWCSKLE